jgi:fatty-acyl-CoA synthase
MKIALAERIASMLAEEFGIEERMDLHDSFIEKGMLTSVQLVNTLFALEDIYDVTFSLDKMDISDLESPIKLADYINTINGLNTMSIRDMFLRICESHMDENALIFDGTIITYRELKDKVETIAANLIEYNVGRGSKVAIVLPNCLEYILSYFALFYLGAWPIPINTRWEKGEIYNVFDDAHIDFIICDQKVGNIQYGNYIADYLSGNKSVMQVFCLGENLYGHIGTSFSILLNELPLVQSKLEMLEGISPAMISYTSGTTGTPKGVVLKHNDIVKISKLTTEYWSAGDDSSFSIAPLYSAQGFLSLFINFTAEICFKMISSFNPNDILKEISKKESTIIHTQPTMWTLLLNCRVIEFVNFDSLTKLVVSGSLCSPELAKRIEEKMGCTLLNAYGLIESTSVVTITRIEDSRDVRYNTVGRPIDGIEIKIVDSERHEVPKGEVGELAVRGYNMLGYYNNPEKTREVMDEDGWLYTGDLAKYYDGENISIVGRCKDMIIRGGFNVYPCDIEEHVLQMPEVQTVAVTGNHHEVIGEEIVAFIVIKAGENLHENDVRKYLRTCLANYKMPDKIYFISEMPIILAGKIDKSVLASWAQNGIPQDKQVLFRGNAEGV